MRFLQSRTVLCLWEWKTEEFLMKQLQLHLQRVVNTFQTKVDLTYHQVEGNIVGQLDGIMLISGYRYMKSHDTLQKFL